MITLSPIELGLLILATDFLGSIAGVFLACCLAISSQADDDAERLAAREGKVG